MSNYVKLRNNRPQVQIIKMQNIFNDDHNCIGHVGIRSTNETTTTPVENKTFKQQVFLYFAYFGSNFLQFSCKIQLHDIVHF
jgi:hypothetical protein